MRNFLVITDNLNAPPWHSSLVVLLDIPAWYSCLIFLPDTPARTAGQTLGRHGLHCSTRGIRNKIKYRKINQMAARSMSGQQKIPWIIKGFTELLTGIGPVTSALPMRRSTDWATAAYSVLVRSREPCIYYHDRMVLSTIIFKFFKQFTNGSFLPSLSYLLSPPTQTAAPASLPGNREQQSVRRLPKRF